METRIFISLENCFLSSNIIQSILFIDRVIYVRAFGVLEGSPGGGAIEGVPDGVVEGITFW